MAAPVAQLELRLAQCRERLTALRGRRAGHADAAERLKGAEAQEVSAWTAELHAREEQAASDAAKAWEAEVLRGEVASARQRLQEVEAAASSHLYGEWRRLFFAHMRAGGDLEDYSMHAFLREVCDVIPLADLESEERVAAETEEDIATLEVRLRNVEETEQQIHSENLRLAGECGALRAQLKDQESTNQGWQNGRLRDNCYQLTLREEQEQHRDGASQLERQLPKRQEEVNAAATKVQLWRQEAQELRREVPQLEERARKLQERAQQTAGGHAELQQRVEVQEFELGRHRLAQLWSSEASQQGRMGQEHQHQALALLRQAAKVRADEANAEQELHRLWARLGEAHREASAQKEALSRTRELREAVEKDVLGLRETNAFLDEERARTACSVSGSERGERRRMSPGLQSAQSLGSPHTLGFLLPETFAGQVPTQASLRGSRGAL